ncbi:MAG: polysaccharide biosynthesis tyrosine autokinase, partial [Zetaproteobacteria bacterium]
SNAIRFAFEELKQRLREGWDYRGVSVGVEVSPYFAQLNKRLIELALKHTELSTELTEAHPQMRELREQAMDVLEAMLDELAKQAEMSQARLEEIQQAIADNEKRFLGAPDEALELQRLERAVRLNEELYDMLEKKYQEVLIREAEKVQEVSLLRPAMLEPYRINPPRTGQVALAGSVLGLVLGLIVALILEAMDTSIGTIEEVEAYLETSVIGYIPHFSRDEAAELFSGMEGLATRGSRLERQMRLVSHFAPRSTIAEAYRSLRTNLMFSLPGEHKAIMVTSSTAKEGKSTVAANIAITFAQQGARVLIIDADLRKPIQHHQFGLPKAPGLVECLLGQMHWRDAVRRFADMMLGDLGVDAALMTPGLDQVDVLTAGETTIGMPELLASQEMKKLLVETREEYDLVVIDATPMLHTTDAAMLAPHVDGVVLVYYIGSVVRAALRRVKQTLEGAGGKLIGVVINGVHAEVSPDYAKYKMDRYYHYAYGEEEDTWQARLRRRWRRTKRAVQQWIEQARNALARFRRG